MGFGCDEFEGSATHRGVDGSSWWEADGWVRGSDSGVERAADASSGVALRRGWWGCPDPSCTWPNFEQPDSVRCSRVCAGADPAAVPGLRPTLAAEVLDERHGIRVGRETVRKWVVEDGLFLSREQRRTFHQPRLRRESLGELVQMDGSQHRWFEDRADPCTLLVFIDDATSRLMQLRFVPS